MIGIDSQPPWMVVRAKQVWERTRQSAAGMTETDSPQQQIWPSPEQSIGSPDADIGAKRCWDIQGPALDIWNEIRPTIKAFLEKHAEPLVVSSVLWTMRMRGKSRTTASPTIIFCCEDAYFCKEAWGLIKRSDLLQNFPGVRLKLLPRFPTTIDPLVAMAYQSGASRLNLDTTRIHIAYSSSNDTNITPSSHIHASRSSRPNHTFHIASSSQRLTPGRTLQISKHSDLSFITQATIGGAVLLHGTIYLMTAAHPFRNSKRTCAQIVQAENELRNSNMANDEHYQPYAVNFQAAHYQNHVPLSSPVVMPSKSSNMAIEHLSSEVEQAASNSAERSIYQDYLCHTPNQTITDQAATGTFTVGTLWLTCEEHSLPELDYALIKMVKNTIYHGPIIDIDEVADSEFQTRANFQDHIHTPIDAMAASTLDRVHGHINRTTALLKLPGSKVYQEVHEVKFDAVLQLGDCGSWVSDTASKRIHGHVIAGSPRDGIAYVVPFHHIIEDLRSVTKASRYQSHRANDTNDEVLHMFRLPRSRNEIDLRHLARQTVIDTEYPVTMTQDGHDQTSVKPVDQSSRGFRPEPMF